MTDASASVSASSGSSSSSSFHSTQLQFHVREQEELASASFRHECGLSAADPDPSSQISTRQPAAVEGEAKMRVMHDDFNGRDSLQEMVETEHM